MTEKRFKLEDIGFVYDNDTLIGMKEIVKCLNSLHEENQALKSDRARYEEECRLDVFKELSEENEQLKEENEQLKSDLRYWQTLAQSLAKGNNIGDFE